MQSYLLTMRSFIACFLVLAWFIARKADSFLQTSEYVELPDPNTQDPTSAEFSPRTDWTQISSLMDYDGDALTDGSTANGRIDKSCTASVDPDDPPDLVPWNCPTGKHPYCCVGRLRFKSTSLKARSRTVSGCSDCKCGRFMRVFRSHTDYVEFWYERKIWYDEVFWLSYTVSRRDFFRCEHPENKFCCDRIDVSYYFCLCLFWISSTNSVTNSKSTSNRLHLMVKTVIRLPVPKTPKKSLMSFRPSAPLKLRSSETATKWRRESKS